MYRLPRTNDTRLPLPRRAGYQLERAPKPLPVTEPRPALRVDHVVQGDAAHGRTPSAQRTPTTLQRFTVNAPANNYKRLALLNINVASERTLPGFLGTIRLICQPDSVDLERLRSGVMNLCADHRLDVPIGRVPSLTITGGNVTGQAEIAVTDAGRKHLVELDQGLRVGVSPGFEILKVAPDPKGQDFDIVVEKFAPYECSLVTAARNPDSRITGRFSMGGNTMNGTTLETPLVNTYDTVGLSLAAGRVALQDGAITDPVRRRQLEKFYQEFDLRIGRGETRNAAAVAARELADIPA